MNFYECWDLTEKHTNCNIRKECKILSITDYLHVCIFICTIVTFLQIHSLFLPMQRSSWVLKLGFMVEGLYGEGGVFYIRPLCGYESSPSNANLYSPMSKQVIFERVFFCCGLLQRNMQRWQLLKFPCPSISLVLADAMPYQRIFQVRIIT